MSDVCLTDIYKQADCWIKKKIQEEIRRYVVNTLKMEAAAVSQTLEIQYLLTNLNAWKDFIRFSINKNFRSSTFRRFIKEAFNMWLIFYEYNKNNLYLDYIQCSILYYVL